MVRGIARTKSPAAQARALETLARLHVSDPVSQDELTRLFAQSTSLPVQRAIAEVFIRAGVGPQPDLAATLRKHRVKASGGDMAAVELANLPALRLERLHKLRTRHELGDAEMVRLLRDSLIDPTAPNPSVETLLHAFLPHKFVDHTHASAVLSLSAARGQASNPVFGTPPRTR